MRRRLLYSSLPVSKTDDLHVGQAAKADKATVLQHEITFGVPLSDVDRFFSHSLHYIVVFSFEVG